MTDPPRAPDSPAQRLAGEGDDGSPDRPPATRGGADFLDALAAPAPEFGVWPFWFWNDDLEEGELLRQLHAFHAAGIGGIVVHPRIGLSPRIGYLTDEYFRLVRRVVDECAALGIGVLLYDEGSYPSGSACGQVVAADPANAARAVTSRTRRYNGPFTGYWRPSVGRSLVARLLCVVVARLEGDRIDPASARLHPVVDRDLVRLDLGPGEWQAVACFEVPSGGVIRGVLPEHEDDAATAPPAGDIMSPAAVDTFIRLTHDAYAGVLGDHLGRTVVGMFTDEPSPLGRRAPRDAWPYTPGFDAYVAASLGWSIDQTSTWLPALWLDYGPGTAEFRRAYTAAVEARIGEVFYRAQAEWCAAHGLALTGHPHASNDMAALRWFDWPGQDAVWRWVSPRNESGMVGAHSVAAKAATSAARAGNRRRIATELFGAYGWQLSLDEAKWLFDWHLARGNNLFIPHALFYSVRGRRAFESEPDVGLHNCWWPHFQELLRYVRRMSWLLTDVEHVCDVAVVGDGHALPWAAARQLYEHQIDFLYLDGTALERSRIADGHISSGSQRYRVVVVDGPVDLSSPAAAALAGFEAAGGTVLRHDSHDAEEDRSARDLIARLRRVIGSPVAVAPPAPHLRVLHVRKDGTDVYALFNEGEDAVEATLAVPARGRWWLVDPLRLSSPPVPAVTGSPPPPDDVVEGGETGAPVRLSLSLPRRESRLLLVVPGAGRAGTGPGPAARDAARAADRPAGSPAADETFLPVTGPWRVTDEEGRRVDVPAPGDWATVPARERFAGTLTYHATVSLAGSVDQAPPGPVVVDLGTVGEAAAVRVNGTPAGRALWAPYVVRTSGHLWHGGENTLEVAVTNSAANTYEGALRPSGLLGPVRLRLRA
jgi:hypothetical protein